MRSVALGFWVDVGSRDERPAIAGASHFLEHLLFKGTADRTARQIAEAFDAVGGDLNAFTAKEYTCYYCRVRDQDLPMAVEFMSDMLQNSVLARADFEAERRVILEEINMRDDDPGDLIHDLFAETLWKGHPLGRPVLGTRETITGVKRDQIKRFYDRLYEPPHFVVAAAGNLQHEDLLELLESQMETGRRLSEGSARKVRAGGDAPSASGATEVLERKTEQAHIDYILRTRRQLRLGRHVLTLLDPPARRGFHVLVLVPSVSRHVPWALLADRHQIDPSRGSVRRRRDHVVHHQVAPVLPADVLAAQRSASSRGR